jgi:hypothetical protein
MNNWQSLTILSSKLIEENIMHNSLSCKIICFWDVSVETQFRLTEFGPRWAGTGLCWVPWPPLDRLLSHDQILIHCMLFLTDYISFCVNSSQFVENYIVRKLIHLYYISYNVVSLLTQFFSDDLIICDN